MMARLARWFRRTFYCSRGQHRETLLAVPLPQSHFDFAAVFSGIFPTIPMPRLARYWCCLDCSRSRPRAKKGAT